MGLRRERRGRSWPWFRALTAGGRLLRRSDSRAAEVVLGRLDARSALVSWAVAVSMAWRFVGLS